MDAFDIGGIAESEFFHPLEKRFHKWEDPIDKAIDHPISLYESQIKGCFLVVREEDGNDCLFRSHEWDQPGRLRVNLVGYAIVPLEDWNELIDLAAANSGSGAE